MSIKLSCATGNLLQTDAHHLYANPADEFAKIGPAEYLNIRILVSVIIFQSGVYV